MYKANTREEIEEYLKKDNHLRYVMECPTGAGKTYMSILKMRQWKQMFGGEFLIVIPKLVLIDNWKEEFRKFNAEYLLEDVTFTTYVSLQKHVDKAWTGIVMDEVHHLSDRCKEMFKCMRYRCFMGLSATLKREVKSFLTLNINGLETVRMTLKDAIDNEVLPNPKVILIPMQLDRTMISEVIVKNPKSEQSIECSWNERNYYRNRKDIKVNIHCTQQQWYDYYTNSIEWMKNKPVLKNAYLIKCGERLKWLSNKKTGFVKEILSHITRHRVITFCNSIEQSRLLGKHSINSKDGVAQDVLNEFNEKRINKVTCVEILTEGLNVADCKIGLFAMLNGTQRLQIQKVGRTLRHKKPVIIIPYYKNTRDQEIVKKMIENYDENMVVMLTDLNKLKDYLK